MKINSDERTHRGDDSMGDALTSWWQFLIARLAYLAPTNAAQKRTALSSLGLGKDKGPCASCTRSVLRSDIPKRRGVQQGKVLPELLDIQTNLLKTAVEAEQSKVRQSPRARSQECISSKFGQPVGDNSSSIGVLVADLIRLHSYKVTHRAQVYAIGTTLAAFCDAHG